MNLQVIAAQDCTNRKVRSETTTHSRKLPGHKAQPLLSQRTTLLFTGPHAHTHSLTHSHRHTKTNTHMQTKPGKVRRHSSEEKPLSAVCVFVCVLLDPAHWVTDSDVWRQRGCASCLSPNGRPTSATWPECSSCFSATEGDNKLLWKAGGREGGVRGIHTQQDSAPTGMEKRSPHSPTLDLLCHPSNWTHFFSR